MKNILLPVVVLLSANVFAQNVGVGVPSPQERLDVSGRLRLSSNNTAGAPTGGAGTIRWNATVNAFQGYVGAPVNDWVSFGSPAGLLSQTLPSGQVFVGNASNIATGVALSGDAAITNAGVLTIGTGAVTTGKILNGTILDEDVNASAAIARTKLASGTANALVVNNGSGVMTGLAPGANGNILTSDGTQWQSANPGTLFIRNQNAATQPTSDFWISGTGRAGTSFQSPVYTRADAGTVSIRPNTDAVTAIQLQNAAGTSILNVDATNQRVGIGTVAPEERLQVDGNVLLSRGGTKTLRVQSANAGNQGDTLRVVSGSAASTGGARSGGSLLLEAGNAYTHTDNTMRGGNLVLRSGGNRYPNPSQGSQWGDIVFESARNVSSSSNSSSVERMRIQGPSGNVGINVTAPTQRLDIDGQVRIRGGVPGAGKVLTSDANGVGAWTDPTGIVTAENGLTETAPATIRLGGALTQATTVSGLTATNKMSFAGTGVDAFNVDGTTLSVDATNDRVGVGTSSPAAKLDVSGGNVALNDNQIRLRAGNDGNHFISYLGGAVDGAKIAGNLGVVISNTSGNRDVAFFKGDYAYFGFASGQCCDGFEKVKLGRGRNGDGTIEFMDNAWGRVGATSGLAFWANGNADVDDNPQMYLASNGRVGIGTTSPTNGLLEVNGEGPASVVSYGFLNPAGNIGTVAGVNVGYSIWASGRIRASEFNAMSDARVKTILQRTEQNTLLDIVNKLTVTEYAYVDSIERGSRSKQGFIAQEIEAVYPNAVSKSTDFVPNLFELSIVSGYDEETGITIISLKKEHGLAVGDEVKLITTEEKIAVDVVEVIDFKTFAVRMEKKHSEVFVYGKKVNDFRAVDYDQIFSIGIGAIQELSKENDRLKLEVEALKIQLGELDELKADLHSIKVALNVDVSGLAGLSGETNTNQ
jgi:hypothetical protein